MANRVTEVSDRGLKIGRSRTPSGRVLKYEIEKTIELLVGPADRKKLVLQKVRYTDGREQLRLGYYVKGSEKDLSDKTGKSRKPTEKWIWGQNAPFLDLAQFAKIVEDARAVGWLQPNAE